MSNYTEEDVRQVGLLLDEDVDTLKPNRRPHARARLDVLRAAALEAAKVPALAEELRLAGEVIRANQSGWEVAEVGRKAALDQVSALQARVEELRREWKRLDEAAITMSRTVDKVMEQRDEARSERDALRARVEAVRKPVATALGMLSEGQHALAEANLRLALSAPPVETTLDAERQRWAMRLRKEALSAIVKHPPVIADDGAGTVSLVWHDAQQQPRSYAVTTEEMRWMLGDVGTPAETIHGPTRDDVVRYAALQGVTQMSPRPVLAPEDRCPRGDHAVWEHERGGKYPLCGTDTETTLAPERAEDEPIGPTNGAGFYDDE